MINEKEKAKENVIAVLKKGNGQTIIIRERSMRLRDNLPFLIPLILGILLGICYYLDKFSYFHIFGGK